jgi:hypothetical protein
MYDFWDVGEVVAEATQLATELGGVLHPPTLKWKYKPVQWLFGYPAAFRARQILPKVRARLECRFDELAYRVSRGTSDDAASIGRVPRRVAPPNAAS